MDPFELRPFRMEDLFSLVKYANDPFVADRLTDAFPHPYTEAHGRAFLERVIGASPTTHRAIVVNGEACGAVGLHAQADVWKRNLELGYWLARKYSGQGIMTDAITGMVEFGFAQYPEVDRIFARPFGSNIASQRVLEKAGFTLEAKLIGTMVKKGRVEDELIYAVRR
ncbi:MAG: GNAT family N-acetyltransferase [Flavobacteriales bacterium]|nr:GNAT family N-acetyltransferase [Flavobacteriales bacterium]MCC6939970.1 GNAT family N-acetyltransferase [Flavobacteriales bacterium]